MQMNKLCSHCRERESNRTRLIRPAGRLSRHPSQCTYTRLSIKQSNDAIYYKSRHGYNQSVYIAVSRATAKGR